MQRLLTPPPPLTQLSFPKHRHRLAQFASEWFNHRFGLAALSDRRSQELTVSLRTAVKKGDVRASMWDLFAGSTRGRQDGRPTLGLGALDFIIAFLDDLMRAGAVERNSLGEEEGVSDGLTDGPGTGGAGALSGAAGNMSGGGGTGAGAMGGGPWVPRAVSRRLLRARLVNAPRSTALRLAAAVEVLPGPQAVSDFNLNMSTISVAAKTSTVTAGLGSRALSGPLVEAQPVPASHAFASRLTRDGTVIRLDSLLRLALIGWAEAQVAWEARLELIFDSASRRGIPYRSLRALDFGVTGSSSGPGDAAAAELLADAKRTDLEKERAASRGGGADIPESHRDGATVAAVPATKGLATEDDPWKAVASRLWSQDVDNADGINLMGGPQRRGEREPFGPPGRPGAVRDDDLPPLPLPMALMSLPPSVAAVSRLTVNDLCAPPDSLTKTGSAARSGALDYSKIPQKPPSRGGGRPLKTAAAAAADSNPIVSIPAFALEISTSTSVSIATEIEAGAEARGAPSLSSAPLETGTDLVGVDGLEEGSTLLAPPINFKIDEQLTPLAYASIADVDVAQIGVSLTGESGGGAVPAAGAASLLGGRPSTPINTPIRTQKRDMSAGQAMFPVLPARRGYGVEGAFADIPWDSAPPIFRPDDHYFLDVSGPSYSPSSHPSRSFVNKCPSPLPPPFTFRSTRTLRRGTCTAAE